MTAAPAAQAKQASVSAEELEKDPLAFVDESMSTEDVANLLFADNMDERQKYLDEVAAKWPDLAPREQLRSVLDGSTAGDVRAAAPPLLVAVAGRALIAAAKRYGPSMFRALKSAVSRGYKSFNQWTKDNPWVAGIIGGVSSAALYDWLKENL